MRRIIFVIIYLILSCTQLLSQFSVDSLPSYYVVGGDTIGVVLSIEQAQMADNDLELLNLLEQKGIDCDSLSNINIKVIDKLGNEVAILKTKVNQLNSIIGSKDDIVENLNEQIINYVLDLLKAQTQLSIKDEQIKNYEIIDKNNTKLVRRLKVQRGLFIGGGVVGVAAGVLFGVLLSK